MKIIRRNRFRKIFAWAMVMVMLFGLTACGKKTESKSSGEFQPSLATDTACSIKVAGSYSNFESLESEFERFYEFYPNVSLNYVYLDDYNNTIASALTSDEAPDIYVTSSWMLDEEKIAPVLEC